MNEAKLPINDTKFWKTRLNSALERGEVHRALYDMPLSTWCDIQEEHLRVLSRIVRKSWKVLDAGCGYGGLLEILPSVNTYIGVDLSPDLIRLARERRPNCNFLVGDLNQLFFEDKEFDVAICRSIDGMVKENLGVEVWRKMEVELLRVARSLILMSYSKPRQICVVSTVNDPEEYTYNRIEIANSHAVYRKGKEGTLEIYDIFVEESCRRQGVGTELVTSLCQEVQSNFTGVVYAFVRTENNEAIEFYKKLNFEISNIPSFYRGGDAVLAVKHCLER